MNYDWRQSLCFAIIQKHMEKSYWIFVEGTSFMLTADPRTEWHHSSPNLLPDSSWFLTHFWIPKIWFCCVSVPETFNPEPFGLFFSLVRREGEWHGGPQKPREGGLPFPLERGQAVVLQTPAGEHQSPEPTQGCRPQGERGDPGRPQHWQPPGAGEGHSPPSDRQN